MRLYNFVVHYCIRPFCALTAVNLNSSPLLLADNLLQLNLEFTLLPDNEDLLIIPVLTFGHQLKVKLP